MSSGQFISLNMKLLGSVSSIVPQYLRDIKFKYID